MFHTISDVVESATPYGTLMMNIISQSMVLERGADLNARDDMGKHMLHYAFMR